MKTLLKRTKWFELYSGFQMPTCRISPASYFDDRAFIILSLGWGIIYLHLPIHSGIDECEPPQYGFYFHGEGKGFDTFVWCWKDKTYHFRMPWDLEWFRTSILMKDGSWFHNNAKDKIQWKEVDEVKNSALAFKEEHSYTYTLENGEVQHRTATIRVSEMEWRMKWFRFTKIGGYIKKFIDIDFSDEVGERTGSWKGGTFGCSYNIKNNETPLECLRRMEIERKF